MLVVIALSHELAIIHVRCGYIVPEASHLSVTVDARSGRVLVVEHKDVSFVHQISVQLRVARVWVTNVQYGAIWNFLLIGYGHMKWVLRHKKCNGRHPASKTRKRSKSKLARPYVGSRYFFGGLLR